MISGSFAAFSITVLPSAFTAANKILIVAPTEAKSKYIFAPTKRSAVITCAPSTNSTFAPNASNPLICKSIGRGPKKQPPGAFITTFLHLPSNAPIK